MAYSESFKARALVKLAENDGAISKTARELGIDRKTLERWVNGELAHPNEVAGLLQQALFKVLSEVPDFSKPGAANSWPQAVKTLVESIQLLTGRPTERTESKSASLQLVPEGTDKADYDEAVRWAISQLDSSVEDPDQLTDEEYKRLLLKVNRILVDEDEDVSEGPHDDPLTGVIEGE